MPATWAADWLTGDIVTAAEFRKSMGCVADSTLGAPAASFDFTGLPTTYAHLHVVAYLRGDTAANSVAANLRFNNDSAGNYDYQYAQASAAVSSATENFAATSMGLTAGVTPANTAVANSFSQTIIDIANYANTSNHKTVTVQSAVKISTAGGGLALVQVAGFWRSATAISRVTILPAAGNWVAGSRVSIYVMGS